MINYFLIGHLILTPLAFFELLPVKELTKKAVLATLLKAFLWFPIILWEIIKAVSEGWNQLPDE